MTRQSTLSFLIILVVMGSLSSAAAQPMHREHRYMVAEHTAISHLTGLISDSFRAVEIKRADVPATVQAGEEALYSVAANVETVTLPIEAKWEFGDGAVKRGLSVRHTFAEPGEYEIELHVANSRSSESRTFAIEVVSSDRSSGA